MKTFFSIVQVVVAVLLSLSILVQQRGSGLSATFGGTGAIYTTRRGPEKVLLIVTVVLAILFVLVSLLLLLI